MLIRHSFQLYKSPRSIQRRHASINYLVSALNKTESCPTETRNSRGSNQIRHNSPNYKGPNYNIPKDITRAIITPNSLNDIFRHAEYSAPSNKQLTATQTIFNRAQVNLEWTYADYNEIPDIKYQALQRKRIDSYNQMDPYNKTEYDENVVNSRKSFGIKPELLRPLPEVLLLGHTNVGKSSLINNLLLNKLESKTAGAKTEYAYVSKRAGYTKTLNCFNVGNKFRLIDSPGYGEYAESSQGKVVLDYIEKRDLLRRVFLLIDGVEGFREEDLQLVNHLISVGVPFEVVLTKTDLVIAKNMPRKSVYDKLLKSSAKNMADRVELFNLIQEASGKVIDYYTNMIDAVQLRGLVTLPKILFNNTTTNKYVTMRHGYKELRCVMLESCGLVDENFVEFKEEDGLANKQRKASSVREV